MRRLHSSLLLTAAVITVLTLLPLHCHAALYSLNKVGDGTYAALAQPGSKAASNALIIIGRYQVVIAGAHFVAEGVSELTREIAKLTPLPIRTVILTHHHKGFSFVDFDFPSTVEMVMSWQTWQAMKSERRDLRNNITFFKTDLTLVRDNTNIVLTNTESGHTTGDVILLIPATGLLFASDLVFNNVIGFMGDSSMRDWVVNLEVMEELGATTVIPGLGNPGPSQIIADFKEFFRDFLTEVIRLKTAKRTLTQAKQEFNLPAKHKKLPGYTSLIMTNLERAYSDQAIH
jgi:glyoxylase-like metal-dependent hydrolase (beta-lactamase superfamily II)